MDTNIKNPEIFAFICVHLRLKHPYSSAKSAVKKPAPHIRVYLRPFAVKTSVIEGIKATDNTLTVTLTNLLDEATYYRMRLDP
jgi:hypothetical protein